MGTQRIYVKTKKFNQVSLKICLSTLRYSNNQMLFLIFLIRSQQSMKMISFSQQSATPDCRRWFCAWLGEGEGCEPQSRSCVRADVETILFCKSRRSRHGRLGWRIHRESWTLPTSAGERSYDLRHLVLCLFFKKSQSLQPTKVRVYYFRTKKEDPNLAHDRCPTMVHYLDKDNFDRHIYVQPEFEYPGCIKVRSSYSNQHTGAYFDKSFFSMMSMIV